MSEGGRDQILLSFTGGETGAAVSETPQSRPTNVIPRNGMEGDEM